MVQIQPKFKTFDDYLALKDVAAGRYELTYGELVEVPPESDDNVVIARAMDRALSDLVGFRRVRAHQLAIEVPGEPKNRFPDITVLRPEHPEQLSNSGQSAIRLEMAPPILVVEIVSPGESNRRRDYVEKRNQYEWRDIPEYWIVDPAQSQVTVLSLTDDGYKESVFKGNQLVKSLAFKNWTLTAEEMLSL